MTAISGNSAAANTYTPTAAPAEDTTTAKSTNAVEESANTSNANQAAGWDGTSTFDGSSPQSASRNLLGTASAYGAPPALVSQEETSALKDKWEALDPEARNEALEKSNYPSNADARMIPANDMREIVAMGEMLQSNNNLDYAEDDARVDEIVGDTDFAALESELTGVQSEIDLRQRTDAIVQEAGEIKNNASVPGQDAVTGIGNMAGAATDPAGAVTGILLEPGKEEAFRATAEHAAKGGNPLDGPEVYINEWAKQNPVVRAIDDAAHIGQPDTSEADGMREYLDKQGFDADYIDWFMENNHHQP